MFNYKYYQQSIQYFMLTIVYLLSISHTNTYATEINPQDNKSIQIISIPAYTQETDKEFDDIVEDMLVAIGEHNFRLTGHSRIGKSIAERNKSAFPLATVIHFCNLDYAKQLLEIAPDYLLRMPCRASIKQKIQGTNGSIIQVWLLPEDDERTKKFAKKINGILIDIVNASAT